MDRSRNYPNHREWQHLPMTHLMRSIDAAITEMTEKDISTGQGFRKELIALRGLFNELDLRLA